MRNLRTEDEIIANWKGDIDKPVVSVICHTYNHVNFIEQSLVGFLNQVTSFPFEIIVHDDASTDGTDVIIQRYAKKFPRLIRAILQPENKFSVGIQPSMITFFEAKGHYIALCEGDDYWINDKKLTTQLEKFKEGVSIVFHDSLIITETGEKLGSYFPKNKKPLKGYSPFKLCKGATIPTASCMVLAKPLKETKRYNIINGDHFNWAVLAHYGKAVFIDEVMSVYRLHEGGIWSSRNLENKINAVTSSKLTIFNFVEKKFKSSALLGNYISMIEFYKGWSFLSKRNKYRLITNSLRSLILLKQCELPSIQGLKDVILILVLTFALYPFWAVKSFFSN